jgi:hypothetical protein
MLTQGDDVEAHALAGRGWSISSIARHLGRDRKTVRAYLGGQRSPGVRRRPAADPIEPFVAYLRARCGFHGFWPPCFTRNGHPVSPEMATLFPASSFRPQVGPNQSVIPSSAGMRRPGPVTLAWNASTPPQERCRCPVPVLPCARSEKPCGCASPRA